jgi:hypothetical protein
MTILFHFYSTQKAYLFVFAGDSFPDVFDFVYDGLFCGLLDDVRHVDAALVDAKG